MKKIILNLFCLLIMSSFCQIRAQQINNSDRQQQMLQEEKKVAAYIKENLEKSLPANVKQDFIESFDHSEHELKFNKLSVEEQKQELQSFKTTYLRHKYFSERPEAWLPYQAEMAPTCTNGGFENGFNNYQGQSASGNTTGYIGDTNGECAAVPTTGFGAFAWTPTALDAINNNDNFTLVGAGNDPVVAAGGGMLNMINPYSPDPNNATSVRINSPRPLPSNNSCWANRGINRLIKPITLTESGVQTVRFYYALVSEFPNHTNRNPIFVARALDGNNTELDRLCVISNPAQNPFFNQINSTNANCSLATVLWQNWTCAELSISGEVGDVINLEFIASDCGAGGHFGYAYIDDICAEKCVTNTDFQGSIRLNDLDPCQTSLPFNLCADFILPQLNGQTGTLTPNNISLDILQGGSSVTTLTNGVITENTVCFTINPSDFPSQTGGYDFQVNAAFSIGNGIQQADDTHTIPGQDNDYIFNNPDCCNDKPYITPYWQHPDCPKVVCNADKWPIHILSSDGTPISTAGGVIISWDNLNTTTNENIIGDWIYASALENWQAIIKYPNGCEYKITYYEDCCDKDIFIKVLECPSEAKLQTYIASIKDKMEKSDPKESQSYAQMQKEIDVVEAYIEALRAKSGDDCNPCEIGIVFIELVDAAGNPIDLTMYDSLTWSDGGSGAMRSFHPLPMTEAVCFTAKSTEYGKECVYQDCFLYECKDECVCDELTLGNLDIIKVNDCLYSIGASSVVNCSPRQIAAEEYSFTINGGTPITSSGNGIYHTFTANGIYDITMTWTVTDIEGCTSTVSTSKSIKIDCVTNPCEAPTKLQFECKEGKMSWAGDPSLEYIVEVTWDDPKCCRPRHEPTSIRWTTIGTAMPLPYIKESNCFSWKVGFKCKDKIIWSDKQCVYCYKDVRPTDGVRTSAKISPNPNDGNMDIEISGKDKTEFTLKVYRFDGTLIKSFNDNRIEKEGSKISWNGKSVLTPGIYFFVITTNLETITKKVIIE